MTIITRLLLTLLIAQQTLPSFTWLPLDSLTQLPLQFHLVANDNSALPLNFQLDILTHVNFYFTVLLHYLGLMYDTSLYVSAQNAHFVISWMRYDHLTSWVK